MLKNETCPHCGKPYHPAGGRYLNLIDDQILGILTHCLAPQPKHTIKQYCILAGISTYTYRLVAQMRLKQPKDIERVLAISTSLQQKESE